MERDGICIVHEGTARVQVPEVASSEVRPSKHTRETREGSEGALYAHGTLVTALPRAHVRYTAVRECVRTKRKYVTSHSTLTPERSVSYATGLHRKIIHSEMVQMWLVTIDIMFSAQVEVALAGSHVVSCTHNTGYRLVALSSCLSCYVATRLSV